MKRALLWVVLFGPTVALASDLSTVSSTHSQYFLPAPQPVDDVKKPVAPASGVAVPTSLAPNTSVTSMSAAASTPIQTMSNDISTNVTPTSAKPVYSLSKDQIVKTIAESMSKIQYCYEQELQDKPNIHGKIVTRFTVGLEGRVTQSEIETTTMNDIQTENCIAYIFSKMKFAKPGTGIVEVSYPVVFGVVPAFKN